LKPPSLFASGSATPEDDPIRLHGERGEAHTVPDPLSGREIAGCVIDKRFVMCEKRQRDAFNSLRRL
jgi:hypothetical protein